MLIQTFLIRSVLYSLLARGALHVLASEALDTPDYVLIQARSRMLPTQTANLERIVSRIALEKTVRAVRWETQNDDE